MDKLTAPDEPEPTVATMVVGESTVNEATGVPPKVSAKELVKWLPVMVIVMPAAAAVGVKEVIVGAGMKVNPSRDAEPPGVVRLTAPVEPEPTVARMVVEERTVKEATGVPPKVRANVPVRWLP